MPSWNVSSLDGRLAVTVALSPLDGTLAYSVLYDGLPVVRPTPIGIDTDLADFSRGLELVSVRTTKIDEQYELPSGKSRAYRAQARECSLRFRRDARPIDLVVRAYGDAGAYRFQVPGEGALTIVSELGGHVLPPAHEGWAAEHVSDYERDWAHRTAQQLREADWQYPLLIRFPQEVWALLSEAAVYSTYVGSRASGDRSGVAAGGGGLLRLDPAGLPVATARPFATPWRVTLVGRRLANIVESSVIEHLNPPTELADVSWVKPGRAAWSWWSGDSTSDYATQLRYVDFAATMGWEYYLCDEGWQEAWMPRLIEHARRKGIGIWLWRDSKYLASQQEIDDQLPQWAAWGIVGIKVDFIYGDSRQQLAVYDRIARAAAQLRLMVNFHGCTKPAGERRRWPHLITREAVYGAEHYKFGGGPSAKFNCIVPFTRNVQGPMDYTPVTYSNNAGLTTAAHQTALAIVFESGVQHLGDRPDVYESNVARALLSACPAAWDETRLLRGEPGRLVVMARRSGDTWFVGVIAAGAASTQSLPLEFLGEGSFEAELYRDGTSDREQLFERTLVTSHSLLQLAMRPNGGCAIRIAPT